MSNQINNYIATINTQPAKEVPAFTDWVSYTPDNPIGGARSNVDVKWRRVGSSMEIQGSFTFTTVSGNNLRIYLPAGHTITTLAAPLVVGYGQKGNTDSAIMSFTMIARSAFTYIGVGVRSSVVSGVPINEVTEISQLNNGESISFFMSVPIQGWTAYTQTLVGTPLSYIRRTGGESFGSTNTRVIRYSTAGVSSGSDITYVPSATNGDSFLINTSGVYAVTMSVRYNSSGGTTKEYQIGMSGSIINTVDGSDTMAHGVQDDTSNNRGTISWTGYIPAGNLIYCKSSATTLSVAELNTITITRLT